MMDAPTEDDGVFLPMESGININGGRNTYMFRHSGATTMIRRKAGKRTFPWDLEVGEHNLHASFSPPPFSPPPLQDEEIPATRRRRLDSIMRSTAAATNSGVCIDLCSDSEDEKPKAKDESSSPDVIDICSYSDASDDEKPKAKEDSTISYLLGKERTPISAATAEATIKTASTNTAIAPASTPPSHHTDDGDDYDNLVDSDDGDVDDYVDAIDDDDDDANTDPVTDTQSTNHPKAAGVTHSCRWTPKEHAELTSAVVKTRKKKCGKECRKDWGAISALLPSRTAQQCRKRWYLSMNHSIDKTTACVRKWTEDQDDKLKNSVQIHGGNDWAAIATLVPDRTTKQCRGRWHNTLKDSIDRTDGRAGTWLEGEDSKLRDAVRMHGGKDWIAIAALIPGRTKAQCSYRWHDVLKHGIDQTAERTGKWTEDEDDKLKHAVHKHGGNDWAAIAALVPGRAKKKCSNRWRYFCLK